MPRTCTVCNHSERDKLDRALLAGEPFRNIAKRYGTSHTALFRHKQADLPATLVRAREAAEVGRADTLLGQLNQLAADARRIQQKAEAGRDYRTALAGVRELTRLVELVARMSDEIEDQQPKNVVIQVVYENHRNAIQTSDDDKTTFSVRSACR
jgi:hypothetical protein